MIRIKIKVIPGASQQSIEWFGDLLKIKVRAAPEKGRANAAVEKLLATKLGLPTSAVKVISGFTQSCKVLEIAIADADALHKVIPT